jgi:type IV fimbrial biogenesis protein FimT
MATVPLARPGLAIVALLLIGAASHVSSPVNALIGDLQFARAQAITQKNAVVTCASSDGASCSDSNHWERGWIVCLDVNNSARCDGGDPVYRVQKAFDGSDTFTASGNTSAILFNREGFAVGLDGLLTITLHDAANTPGYTRCVAISAVGTLQVQKAGIGSCR